MAKPRLLFLLALLFSAQSSRTQEQFHFPDSAPPRLSVQRTSANELHFSVNTHTNVLVDLLQSDSMAGPWNSTSWTQPIASHNSFFQARVNTGYIRNGPYTTFFAIRMAELPPPDFTTTNAFHLRLEVTNWYEGISIYRVDDGPSSGDLAADFDGLLQELNSDPRTQFISTTSPTSGTFGALCYTGASDIFQIRKNSSTNLNHLADFDLVVLQDEPTSITARWTKAKTMIPSDFETTLNASGIDAFQITLGCALWRILLFAQLLKVGLPP